MSKIKASDIFDLNGVGFKEIVKSISSLSMKSKKAASILHIYKNECDYCGSYNYTSVNSYRTCGAAVK